MITTINVHLQSESFRSDKLAHYQSIELISILLPWVAIYQVILETVNASLNLLRRIQHLFRGFYVANGVEDVEAAVCETCFHYCGVGIWFVNDKSPFELFISFGNCFW